MNYRDFEYAFVLRICRHGGEPLEEILDRKRCEIDSNGWTLWAFRRRPGFKDAHRCLSREKIGDVYAFCIEGGNEPSGKPLGCTHYRRIGTENCERLPDGIRVLQHFGAGKRVASAFIVRKIIHPVKFSSDVEWLSSEGKWRDTRRDGKSQLPSGEYLIRRKQNGAPLGRISAVLELKSPYLAEISVAGRYES